MCGIVGVCYSSGSAEHALIAGLKSLEYRGYDSAGVALHAEGMPRRRAEGRVDDLVAVIDRDPLPVARIGIAHTRWATHGVPAERNAHPHRFDRVTLVHNGILENHDAMRTLVENELRTNGSTWSSETDSEVWAALLRVELGNASENPTVEDMLGAISRAMLRARGSYALAILHDAIPDRVFFARHESPLVVGIGEGGNFVASDVAALLEETRDFVYLQDGQCGYVTADECAIFDETLQPVDLPIDTIEWDAESAEKGGYPHFMLKEIEEQPLVVGRTLQASIGSGSQILPDFAIPDEELAGYQRIIILACGTALHAARLGKYLLEEAAGIPVTVDFASEFRYRNPMVGENDLVLAISQSGETADTLGAYRVAIDKGARPIAICNVRGSSLCRLSNATILTQCGPEIGVASTKAFTGQLLAIHLLALRLGRARGKLDDRAVEARLGQLRIARHAMDQLVGGAARDHVARIATQFAHKPIYFFLGRGPDYPIALEGALKLKEISYVHAEG
ncbi:MAG: glutamine--fructose-6-phosphate transaminase (isomerizing), partial [Planctomycetes bacterium]|nr:glutamine--fructose-6-phosphate transaminase (isomerizing) [Planctomycetota bacterium]